MQFATDREFRLMPVLRIEPTTYPESLFEGTDAEGTADRQWRVMHVRPRQEKSLARELHQQELPFYLPLIARRSRLRGRTITSHVPLFPSYIFTLATPDERIDVLSTGRIVHSLEVTDQEQLWHDLRQINQLIISGAPLTPEDRLAPGALVRIRSGPLAGLEGSILRSANGRRFLVQVNFIQRGASVLLDDFDLVEL